MTEVGITNFCFQIQQKKKKKLAGNSCDFSDAIDANYNHKSML